MKKGNYWVYESKTIQLESKLVTLNQADSIFIKNDTLLSGHHYYKLENMYGLSQLKRDSLGYIIDNQGQIEFSHHLTTDTLYKGAVGFGFMGNKVEKVAVPAGSFSAVSFYVLQKLPSEASPDSNNPTFFNDQYSIVRKVWYTKNVGVVKSVLYYGSSTAFERNLIRYKVR